MIQSLMTRSHRAMSSERVPSSAQTVFRAALTGGVIAAVINAVWLLVGNAVIDGSVRTASPGSSDYSNLAAWRVAIATLVASVAAGVLYLGLTRFAPARARTIFLAVVAVATLASFGAPHGLDIPGSQKFILTVMHMVTGVVVAGALTFRRGTSSAFGRI